MTQALVIAPTEQTAIQADPYQPGDFDGAWRLAQIVVKSRLAPGVDTPEQAFMILATGHELGLSPMQSLRGIHPIKGRPCPSADTLAAVVLHSGMAEFFREVETTDTSSTWETRRRGDGKTKSYTFTLEEAKRAGLIQGGGNWQKYPRRMLAARAKAFLARDVYPDLTLGLYTPDEIAEGRATPEYVEAIAQTPTQTPSTIPAPPVVVVEVPDFVGQLTAAQSLDEVSQISKAVSSAVRAGSLVKGSETYTMILAAATEAKARLATPDPAAQEEPGSNG